MARSQIFLSHFAGKFMKHIILFVEAMQAMRVDLEVTCLCSVNEKAKNLITVLHFSSILTS